MKSRKAVTLVELLIVVLILAALSAITIPRVTQSAQNARDKACTTNIGIINNAIEMYASDQGGIYPASDDEMKKHILDNLDYFPDGAPKCPLGGTYSLNLKTKRVSCNHK